MQSTWDFRTSSSRDLSHRVYRVFTHLPVLRPDISAISPSYREDPPSTFQSSSLLLPFEVSFDISVVASLKLKNAFLSFDLLSLLDETDANGIKENLISLHFACTKIILKNRILKHCRRSELSLADSILSNFGHKIVFCQPQRTAPFSNCLRRILLLKITPEHKVDNLRF